MKEQPELTQKNVFVTGLRRSSVHIPVQQPGKGRGHRSLRAIRIWKGESGGGQREWFCYPQRTLIIRGQIFPFEPVKPTGGGHTRKTNTSKPIESSLNKAGGESQWRARRHGRPAECRLGATEGTGAYQWFPLPKGHVFCAEVRTSGEQGSKTLPFSTREAHLSRTFPCPLCQLWACPLYLSSTHLSVPIVSLHVGQRPLSTQTDLRLIVSLLHTQGGSLRIIFMGLIIGFFSLPFKVFLGIHCLIHVYIQYTFTVYF